MQDPVVVQMTYFKIKKTCSVAADDGWTRTLQAAADQFGRSVLYFFQQGSGSTSAATLAAIAMYAGNSCFNQLLLQLLLSSAGDSVVPLSATDLPKDSP